MIIMMIFTCQLNIFHKISIYYFEDYLMTKLDLRVRVIPNLVGLRVPKVSEDNKVIQ
jgi:hypothetical protein